MINKRESFNGFIGLVQNLQAINFPFELLFSEEPITTSDEDSKDNCYAILEYETNLTKILRNNYYMIWEMGQIIRIRF